MKEEIITSYEEWVDLVETFLKGKPNEFTDFLQFRGQAKYNWDLKPSLLRLVIGDKISEEKAEFYETQSQFDFLSQAHFDKEKLPSNKDKHPALLLTDMQHYSCPTRLLDWTLSPYIALYFAINDNFDQDGAVYIWDNKIYYNNLKILYPNHIAPQGFEIIDFKDYDLISSITPVEKNNRLIRQQGLFSISNNILKSHDQILNETAEKTGSPNGLTKVKIPNNLKIELLARLRTMNITSESLFPGLDGLGKTIKETLLIRKWRRI